MPVPIQTTNFPRCALVAQADYLVTGNLRHFPAAWTNTGIVTARSFLDAIIWGKSPETRTEDESMSDPGPVPTEFIDRARDYVPSSAVARPSPLPSRWNVR